MSTFACPGCQSPLTLDMSLAGQAVQCPYCSHQFVVPSVQGTPPTAPALPSAHSVSPSIFSSTVYSRFKKPESIFDILFDFRFEKYLTPWIIRFTWIVALVMSGIGLFLIVYYGIGPLLPQAAEEDPMHGNFEFRPDMLAGDHVTSEGFLRFVVIAWLSICVLINLLWIRVLLESIIVIFNIAQSLVSIDRKAKG